MPVSISVNGHEIPIDDDRLLRLKRQGRAPIRFVSEEAGDHETSWSEYDSAWVKFVDMWKTRYGNKPMPSNTQMLALASCFIKPMGHPPLDEMRKDILADNAIKAHKPDKICVDSGEYGHKKLRCNGKNLLISEWPAVCGVSLKSIRNRLAWGWPIHEALGYG